MSTNSFFSKSTVSKCHILHRKNCITPLNKTSQLKVLCVCVHRFISTSLRLHRDSIYHIGFQWHHFQHRRPHRGDSGDGFRLLGFLIRCCDFTKSSHGIRCTDVLSLDVLVLKSCTPLDFRSSYFLPFRFIYISKSAPFHHDLYYTHQLLTIQIVCLINTIYKTQSIWSNNWFDQMIWSIWSTRFGQHV